MFLEINKILFGGWDLGGYTSGHLLNFPDFDLGKNGIINLTMACLCLCYSAQL